MEYEDYFTKWAKLLRNAEASRHSNDNEKWDMQKPMLNIRRWSLRNILKKAHYAS